MRQGYRFYILLAALLILLSIWRSQDLWTGPMPTLPAERIQQDALSASPLRLLYVWGEWCGICTAMQPGISTLAQQYPVVTLALNSGDTPHLQHYLQQRNLNWTVINDQNGQLANTLGVHAVPALFFLNEQGEIVLTSAGFTSVWGMQFRLWLTKWL